MSRRERQRRRRRNHGHPVKRVLVISGVLSIAAVAIAAMAVVGWVVAVADSAPNLSQLTPRSPHPLTQIFAADGSLLGYVHSDEIYSHVTPSQIPATMRAATVAIEDRRFYHHGALDYQGILRAGIKDVFGNRTALQGASTLTMQLVDNLFIPKTVAGHHNLRYKIIQAKLAQQLEKRHTKNWILDTYLNSVPYGTVGGQTAIGIGAASQIFFGKPVWQLDLAQQAMLAGLPQAPSAYNPVLAPHLTVLRRHDVLTSMVKSHYITQAQADAADAEPLGVHVTTTFNTRRDPYVFDYVVQQLIDRFGVAAVRDGGLKVYTTLDPRKQQQAESAVKSHEGGTVLDAQPAAALASVDPSNGHVLALANSSNYKQTNFDFAAAAHRQPGSAFKVFVLMTLIHDYGGDPNQTYYTSRPLTPGWLPGYPTYKVKTAEDTYQGTINIAHATVLSDNTVFAQLDADLGPEKVRQTAYDMGITTHLDAFPAEAIGGLRIGVTPLEMADAYATLANGGYHIPATILDHVVFANGNVTNLGNPPRRQVLTYGEAYTAIQVLKQVITSGTGTAANYGCPAAGKTGTAESYDNAWFVGFSPHLSTAVWVGYPQGNVSMPNGFGGTLAAPIWHDYMRAASGGFCGDWPAPSVPFSGTAFVGQFATSGSNKQKVGAASGSSGNTGNPYNNPTLFAAPPQPPPAPPPNFGNNTGSGTGKAKKPTGGGHAGGSGGGTTGGKKPKK